MRTLNGFLEKAGFVAMGDREVSSTPFHLGLFSALALVASVITIVGFVTGRFTLMEILEGRNVEDSEHRELSAAPAGDFDTFERIFHDDEGHARSVIEFVDFITKNELGTVGLELHVEKKNG